MRCLRISWAIFTILLLCSYTSAATDSSDQTEDSQKQSIYLLKTIVISAAGSPGISTQYQTNGSLGQSTPIGTGTDGDRSLYAGFWSIWLQLSGLSDIPLPEPLVDQLFQNFPNPFNPLTTIRYSVAEENRVRIAIYNVRGECMRILVNEYRTPGWYQVVWDGKNDGGRVVASGVYFCTLRVGDFGSSQKMLLLK